MIETLYEVLLFSLETDIHEIAYHITVAELKKKLIKCAV